MSKRVPSDSQSQKSALEDGDQTRASELIKKAIIALARAQARIDHEQAIANQRAARKRVLKPPSSKD
jgi:hypothetical protein